VRRNTLDPKIRDEDVLTAMMAIAAIYEPYEVARLNHGIGYATAAIELILPTYNGDHVRCWLTVDRGQSERSMRENGMVRSMEERGVTKEAELSHGESVNIALFERMRSMHRAWLCTLRKVRAIESECGMRLLAAKSPSEATNICSEWMAKRAQVVASEHQAFADAYGGETRHNQFGP
jgi:hypothetical protein